MMIEGIIYKYTSPSGKVYIGQTIDEQNRRAQFLNDKIEYAGPKINKARLKYGVYNFDYEIIFKVCSNIKSEIKDILNEKEIYYIDLYKSYRLETNFGFNLTKGGNYAKPQKGENNPNFNKKWSLEKKNYMSLLKKQQYINGEIKFGSLFKVYKKHKGARKVRNPRTGETFPKEAKDELGCKVMREGKNLFDK